MIAQSLLKDGDLKVLNNYAAHDYRHYYPGVLDPHFTTPSPGRRQVYSIHSPGVAALVAPAFLAGGYWAVVLWIAALTALGTAFVWKASHSFTDDPAAAWFGWASVTVTVPVAVHGTLIYPDPVAAVALSAGVLALASASARSRHRTVTIAPVAVRPWWTRTQLIGLGVAVGGLPWLHTRLALPAATLFVVLLLRMLRTANAWSVRDSVAFTVPVVVSVSAWFSVIYGQFGTINPAAAYGDRIPLQISQSATNLLALAVDQEFGILPNGPVHLLWLPGLWAIYRRDARLAIEMFVVLVPYAVAASGYSIWWGGSSPPARFLVPVVLPCGLALAALWARVNSRSRAVCLVLLCTSALITFAIACGADGSLAYNTANGRSQLLDWASPVVNLAAGVPTYFSVPPDSPEATAPAVRALLRTVAVWLGVLFVSWVVWRILARSIITSRDASAAPVVFSACFVGGLMLAIEATWRSNDAPRLQPTRSQFRLLAGGAVDRPVGLDLGRAKVLTRQSVHSLLRVSTGPLEQPPEGALLFLRDVPPGAYSLRVNRRRFSRGEITLRIGAGSAPVERWSLDDPEIDNSAFVLPAQASVLHVSGDDQALQSIQNVELVPVGEPGLRLPEGVRVRDAVRYGSVVVHVIDRRVWLHDRGFWIAGDSRSRVLIVADQPVPLTLELRNVDVANHLRLVSGDWSIEKDVAAGETWTTPIPASRGTPVLLGFEVARGVRKDGRSLGSFVTIR